MYFTMSNIIQRGTSVELLGFALSSGLGTVEQ